MSSKIVKVISMVWIYCLLNGCTGQPLSIFQKRTPTSFPAFLDTSVDIGGHTLPLKCRGTGEPTIILENGIMWIRSSPTSWDDADLARYGQLSRTCIYLRAGQNGDTLTGSRTTQDQVKDLHDLLTRVGVPKPYILVGHSIAGLNIVLFTSQYPDEVVGLVCVDCVPPAYPLNLPGENIEALDINTSLAQAQKVTSLGNLPLVVLVAEGTPRTYAGWLQASETLSQLSTRGRLVVVPGVDHLSIPKSNMVGEAIKEVLQATKK
jgi:pimeloyl-ACP methyl ester carboxylesterase